MLGAVVAWFVADHVPGPAPLAFAAALVLSPLAVGLVAVLADRLVLKRLDYDPEATIVATIGMLYLFEYVALTLFGPDARPIVAPFDARLHLPGFGYSAYKLAIIVAALLLLGGLWYGLTRTRIGLVLRATEGDGETATAFGINVDMVYAGVFGLGAALAALSAVLVVPTTQAHYLMGSDPLLLSFIVVILGGLGSLRGTLFAALLIGLSDGIVSVFLPVFSGAFTPTLSKIIATLFVALVLVFRPQGLFGRVER